MKLHELRSPEGSRTKSRRIGRGTGSGRGKTSGRGQKGQLARSEGFRLGFEGGQMPLAQRLPKLGGFKNRFKKYYAVVNLTKLNRFEDGATVELHGYYEAGLAKPGDDIKLLGSGKLRRKLTIEAHAASESARAAIEARGGKLTIIGADEAAAVVETKRVAKAEQAERVADRDARNAPLVAAAAAAAAVEPAAKPKKGAKADKAEEAEESTEPRAEAAEDGDEPKVGKAGTAEEPKAEAADEKPAGDEKAPATEE
jgi:large subunit ribosomal protein L15